jgi:hypothetical protein
MLPTRAKPAPVRMGALPCARVRTGNRKPSRWIGFVRRSSDTAVPWSLVADAASAPLVVNDTVSYLPVGGGQRCQGGRGGLCRQPRWFPRAGQT